MYRFPGFIVLYILTGNRRIRATRVLSRNDVVQEGEQVIPDSSRTRLFVFNSQGYHVRTLNALTRSVEHEFIYSEDFKLQGVIDEFNRTLTIERMSDGRLRAFVAPSGERSVVTLNPNGMLLSLSDPDGEGSNVASFEYNENNLVTSYQPPLGCQQTYE